MQSGKLSPYQKTVSLFGVISDISMRLCVDGNLLKSTADTKWCEMFNAIKTDVTIKDMLGRPGCLDEIDYNEAQRSSKVLKGELAAFNVHTIPVRDGLSWTMHPRILSDVRTRFEYSTADYKEFVDRAVEIAKGFVVAEVVPSEVLLDLVRQLRSGNSIAQKP
jgi:hypothetical protein